MWDSDVGYQTSQHEEEGCKEGLTEPTRKFKDVSKESKRSQMV